MKVHVNPWIIVSLSASGGFSLIGVAMLSPSPEPRTATAIATALLCIAVGVWLFSIHTCRLILLITDRWLWSLDIKGGRLPRESIELVAVRHWLGGLTPQYIISVSTNRSSFHLKALGGYSRVFANWNARRLGRWIGLPENRILIANDNHI